MTIKTRNRFNNFIFIISLVVFVLNIVFFVYREINYSVDYKSLSVYISLFFMGLYVCLTSLIMTHAFEKTQCTEICFFSCFLIACLAETSRLYIPMFDVGETSSLLLIVLGNFSAFARILTPLSFLFSVIMSGADQRQNLERNILLILVIALFFAVIIPQNTSIIEPTFRVHIGFDTTVVLIEILTNSCAVISLIIKNIQNGNSQRTAVGMTMVIAGFVLSVNSTTYVNMGLSVFFLTAGTYLYLSALHAQTMYD